MKKTAVILLVFVFLFSFVQTGFAAGKSITVDSSWSVLVPESPTQYETYAAEKLAGGLSEALGADIPTVTQARDKYIAVGSASGEDVSGIAVNGYIIKAADGNIHIAGTGVRGLCAGVYRFLEEFCGRKVYTGGITVLPAASDISVPADTNIKYEPFFEYTDTDWKSPRDVEYSLANGLNGGTYRRLPAEAGGTVDYLGGFCHTMGGLCETESVADKDPEQLALFNGKRTTDQPCLTNPDVLATATKNVLAILERSYNPEASLQIVSVTQNDNQHYCECERCKKFEAAHGGVQSATMINFVNQIADAVKKAGYANAAIDTFAYQYTRKAPEKIAPRDNVIVRLCTIECCFLHPLDDAGCSRNVELMKDLHDWSEICKRIYVWDYTTNYSNTCIVFPDFEVIQRNIQVFSENNVRGVYEEGNYYIDGCDTEFGELRAYMISKCLQDPYCDLESEINGFLAVYYGPGWENIKKIIDKHVDNACGGGLGHLSIGESPSASFSFSSREVKEIDALWEAAKKAAANDTQAAHIGRSELSWRFWKASVGKGEFSILNPERFDLRQELFEDLQRYGVTSTREGSYGDYLDCICIRYAPANEWNMYEAGETGAETRLFFGKLLKTVSIIFHIDGDVIIIGSTSLPEYHEGYG